MNRSESIGIVSGAIGTASVLIGYLLEAIRQHGDCDLGNKSLDTIAISVLLIVVIGGLAGALAVFSSPDTDQVHGSSTAGLRYLRITQARRNAHGVRSGAILRERSDTGEFGVIEVPFTAQVIAIAMGIIGALTLLASFVRSIVLRRRNRRRSRA